MARPSPTVWRTLAMVASMKCCAVHVGFVPQIWKMKFFRICVPCGVAAALPKRIE
jgi:hypothetical protein